MIMATKRKVKRYNGEDGSDIDVASMDVPTEPGMGASAGSDYTPPKSKSFKDAFRDARNAGDKTFEWEGKKYTTELAKSKDAAPAVEKPKLRQETMQERAQRYVEKRAAARAAEAASSPRGQDRILTNMRTPKSSEYTGMGSLKFASGGKVSSASKRADGCAQRGKTRGRMV